MKKLGITLLIIGMSIFSYSQTIKMEKSYWSGYKYFQNDKRLLLADVVTAVKSNKEAHRLLVSGKSDYVLSQVAGAIGGGLVGWPIGTALSGGEPNWILAGVGAGFIIVSIPLSSSGARKIKKGIDTYNAGINNTSSHSGRLNYHLVVNKNGLVWQYRFKMQLNTIDITS